MVLTLPRPGAPAAGGLSGRQSAPLAGRGGPSAQLVGVMGVFAVVGAQVAAKATTSATWEAPRQIWDKRVDIQNCS